MEPKEATLKPGTFVDRLGGPEGMFLYPQDTPIEQRSLPPHVLVFPYYCYEVLRPFEVVSAEIAPWFDQPGGGTQHMTKYTKIVDPRTGKSITPTARDLVRLGYLRLVEFKEGAHSENARS
ncbi:TNT domain-containing protein [Bacillus sp. FSL W7-1360]